MALYCLRFGEDGFAIVRSKNGDRGIELVREGFELADDVDITCDRIAEGGEEELLIGVGQKEKKKRHRFLDEKDD